MLFALWHGVRLISIRLTKRPTGQGEAYGSCAFWKGRIMETFILVHLEESPAQVCVRFLASKPAVSNPEANWPNRCLQRRYRYCSTDCTARVRRGFVRACLCADERLCVCIDASTQACTNIKIKELKLAAGSVCKKFWYALELQSASLCLTTSGVEKSCACLLFTVMDFSFHFFLRDEFHNSRVTQRYWQRLVDFRIRFILSRRHSSHVASEFSIMYTYTYTHIKMCVQVKHIKYKSCEKTKMY